MNDDARVRFADGFDRPERIAFGLEAPQLAVVVAGSLLAWTIFHTGAPVVLRGPLAAVVAAVSAALGWGRWEERPLLTWGWLAMRFAALPRSGGGQSRLLRAEPDDADASSTPDPSAAGSPEGAASGQPPGTPRSGRRRSPDAAAAPGCRGASVPAWARWISPRTAAVEKEALPAEIEPQQVSRDLPPRGSLLGDLDFETATHALITGRRRATPRSVSAADPPERESVVLLPIPGQGGALSSQGQERPRAGSEPDEAALAPVLALRAANVDRAPQIRQYELDDRAEPLALPAARRPDGRMRRVALFALSGGSGRTTLAVEAACLLAAGGRHVALVDMDLQSPAVAMRLGLPQPERWHPVLLGGDRIGSLDDLLLTHSSGARIMVGPARAVTGDAMAPARIAELLHLLERSGAELTVLDLPGDLGAISTVALTAMDEVFIVVTPTVRGVRDAYRSTEALRRIGLGERLRYVVNRARAPVDLSEVMGDLGGQVVATIPYDAALESGEETHRLAGVGGEMATVQALQRLATRLLGTPAPVAGFQAHPGWG